MVGNFYFTKEILKSDCYTVNLKREYLGRGKHLGHFYSEAHFLLEQTAEQSGMLSILSKSFYLTKKSWCDGLLDRRVVYMQRHCLRMQLGSAACRGIQIGSEYGVE